jgi:hypothetical protein
MCVGVDAFQVSLAVVHQGVGALGVLVGVVDRLDVGCLLLLDVFGTVAGVVLLLFDLLVRCLLEFQWAVGLSDLLGAR